MRLLSLELKNFKGHKSLDVHFGDITKIIGANGTGKTSIFDAFCFVLTGKDSLEYIIFYSVWYLEMPLKSAKA